MVLKKSEAITAKKKKKHANVVFKGVDLNSPTEPSDHDQPAVDEQADDQFADFDYDIGDYYSSDYDDDDDYNVYSTDICYLDDPSEIFRCRSSQFGIVSDEEETERETLKQSELEEEPPIEPSDDQYLYKISEASTDEYDLNDDTSQIFNSDPALDKAKLRKLRYRIPSISNLKAISELYIEGKQKRRESKHIISKSFHLFSSSDSNSDLDTIKNVVKYVGSDDGVFVNPTTGVVLKDSSEPDLYMTEDMEFIQEVQNDNEISSGFDYSSDSIFDEKEADVIDVVKTLRSMIAYERFEENLEPERNEQISQDIVFDFLTKLMTLVANKIEQNESLKYGKSKIWKYMSELVATYYAVLNRNRSLTNQMIEYYRLSRNKRAITALQKDVEVLEQAKYKDQLQILDQLLEKELQVKDIWRNVSIKTYNDYDKIGLEVSQREAELDEHIRKALVRSKGEKFEKFVNECLGKIALKRKQISEMRLLIIFRQNTIATLKAKLETYENIAENMRLTNYLSMLDKMHTLEKKFQGLQVEENFYRSTRNSNVHIVSHLKEKLEYLTNVVIENKSKHQIIKYEAKKLNDSIMAGKILNSKILRETQVLTRKGGLLTKPDLMYDYDTTLEKVNVLKMVVKELTKKLKDIMVAKQYRIYPNN